MRAATRARQCPALFPTTFALVWKRQTRAAAIIAPLCGFAAGVSTWIATAVAIEGSASIPALGMAFPCMYATVARTFTPLPITIAISYLVPDNTFDWPKLARAIERVEDDEHGQLSAKATHFDYDAYFSPQRVRYMRKMARVAFWWGVITLCQWVLWPIPMYGAYFIMSKGLFTAWVVVSLIWLWIALGIASFYPLIDGGAKMIWMVLTGKKVEPAGEPGDVTPAPSVVSEREKEKESDVVEIDDQKDAS